MTNKKKKGFTLIELISVLVILAILVLIVTPLVLNIIRKARVSADKRSIDAYGRSIELAIASYLLDEGKFPTSVEQLTIEYTGDKVECETTKLNTDSSVYLASCTVAGRTVENYTYGKEETIEYDYRVGTEVTYNNVEYYVLKDSTKTETTVTLLKKTPLTTQEVNEYGAGHVNMYATDDTSASYYQKAYDINGYGGMQYYSSTTCGYNGSEWVYDGCKKDYAQSEVKYVVDAWKTAKSPLATNARLITYDEIMENAEKKQICTGSCYEGEGLKYDWLYNSNYTYWTMSPYEDSGSRVWFVFRDGSLIDYSVGDYDSVVRPVITLSKSSL